jgi:hypothetical protein
MACCELPFLGVHPRDRIHRILDLSSEILTTITLTPYVGFDPIFGHVAQNDYQSQRPDNKANKQRRIGEGDLDTNDIGSKSGHQPDKDQ